MAPGSGRGYLLEILVAVDVFLVMGVLQPVGLHILPQGLDDGRAALCVQSQQSGQAGIQFELGRLVVQHEEQRTTHTQVPWPLHLEPIRLLSGGCPVPLHEVVVRAIKVFVQLNDQALEEGRELPLLLAGVIQELPLHPQLPGGNAAVRILGIGLRRVKSIGDIKTQLALLL